MIITDIRREFFDQLAGRILIMCSIDVDAIAACKILQFLLESFNLQYSVAPISSYDTLWKSFEEYRNSIDVVVLINFGNMINIPRQFLPPENLNFYVIDSHRPINVYNFYKNSQVKVYINKNENDLNIPKKSKIFLKNNNQDLEEDDEENLALLTANPQDLTNEQLEKRRELRNWLLQKQKLMFDYEEHNFYNRSVAVIMHDLAWYLSKSNNYLLWLGILGLTYQFKSEKVNKTSFDEEVERINRHINRNAVSSSQAKGNRWKIKWQTDLQIDLYRKWTVYESFWHTPLTFCKFRLWNDKGVSDLREFLSSQCGLKMDQCKQQYIAMELDYKSSLISDIRNVCSGDLQYKYNLQELISRGFVMKEGFKNILSANDVVLAIRGLLESHEPELTMTEKFVRAIQSLSSDDFNLLEKGFECARTQLVSIFEQVKTIIVTAKVIDSGIFLHVDLQDQAGTAKDFCIGDSLITFTRFLQQAHVESKSTRIARRLVRLPFILFCPDYYNQDQVILVGVPPLAQESKKNFFGKAFEQAASNIECEIRSDLSETNLIRANINMKNQLLDQIKLLLDQ